MVRRKTSLPPMPRWIIKGREKPFRRLTWSRPRSAPASQPRWASWPSAKSVDLKGMTVQGDERDGERPAANRPPNDRSAYSLAAPIIRSASCSKRPALGCPVHRSLPGRDGAADQIFLGRLGLAGDVPALTTTSRAVPGRFGTAPCLSHSYCPSSQAKIKGAQIVASLSTTNFGVEAASLPQVIFSFGTAPE